MLSNALQKALNEQIKNELYSSYLYLAMSAHFEAASFPGFAKWTRIQSNEELEHGMKFFDFINDRDGRVGLLAIDAPPVEFGTPLEVFKMVLEHEVKVTGTIHRLYELALKENDYPTQVMLHWFIDEQVEEEKNATAIVDQLQMADDHKGLLLNIDHHVGKRGAE
ncbi:MAG: ferritin [Chloroflexi bacterium RBG_16_57_11]|nr:MAG: ferritin [Chloroflexi bacterium RBG_16_57_11]